jgi:hypothetical protein
LILQRDCGIAPGLTKGVVMRDDARFEDEGRDCEAGEQDEVEQDEVE